MRFRYPAAPSSLTIFAQNASLRSMPTAGIPRPLASFKTVPLPANGSSTGPFLVFPMSRHRLTKEAGKAAGWVRPKRGRDSIVQTSSSPAFSSGARLNRYFRDFTNIKINSYERLGRSWALGSGIGFFRLQMIEDRNIQSRSIMARATLHGMPSNVFFGGPRPALSTAAGDRGIDDRCASGRCLEAFPSRSSKCPRGLGKPLLSGEELA